MVHTLPVISIILPTYNSAKTLIAALESIRKQNSSNIDLIVIDGASNDGTQSIIKEYESIISTWISEPDEGIYEAMNKGIDRATGDWLYFLGSDDQLSEGIIKKISSFLNDKVDVVYGSIVYDTGHVMNSKLGVRTILENRVHHQSAFYHRSLFQNFRYNIDYRVISDYELNLIIYLNKKPALSVPYIIALCGSTGTSSILSSKEVNHLRSKYIKNLVVNKLLSITLDTYYIYVRTKRVMKYSLTKFF